MSFVIALIFWLLVGQLLVWLPGYLYRLSDRSWARGEAKTMEKFRDELAKTAEYAPGRSYQKPSGKLVWRSRESEPDDEYKPESAADEAAWCVRHQEKMINDHVYRERNEGFDKHLRAKGFIK